MNQNQAGHVCAAAALLWLAAAPAPALGPGPQPPSPEARSASEAEDDRAAPLPPAGSFGDRIDVAIVNVDVWVSDRNGIPVTGLKAESFEVLHDGEPVPISHFVEVRAGRVAAPPPADAAEPDAARPETPAPPSHLVVYFDRSRLHPTNVGPLVAGLEEMLASGAVEPERVLVLRQERGLAVEAPFGSTGEELRQALDRLSGAGGAGGLDLESDTRMALDAIRRAWEQSQDNLASLASGVGSIPDVANPTGEPGGGGGLPSAVVGGVGSAGDPDACGSYVNLVQPTLDAWARSSGQRIATTLSNLSDAVSFLAGLPGVKMLVYLSDGLDTRPGEALFTYASSLCPSGAAELLSGARSEDLTDRVLELTRHANTNRVTIYSLQATGLRSPTAASAAADRGVRGGAGQRSSGTFEARRRTGEQEGMRLIAQQTGGRAVFERNVFGPELARIGDAARTYYSLAYELPEADAEVRSHAIEVELADGSLVARYRRGFRRKSVSQGLTERIEGALYLGITSNPLEIRLAAGGVEAGEEGASRLPLHVMVPVERLTFLPRDGEWVAEIQVEILARSFATNVLAMRGQTFRIKGAPGATGLANLPLVLELREGTHLAAVGVLDQASGQVSSVSTTLEVGRAEPAG